MWLMGDVSAMINVRGLSISCNDHTIFGRELMPRTSNPPRKLLTIWSKKQNNAWSGEARSSAEGLGQSCKYVNGSIVRSSASSMNMYVSLPELQPAREVNVYQIHAGYGYFHISRTKLTVQHDYEK